MVDVVKLPKKTIIKHGSHGSYGEGACAMELVDYLDRRRKGKRVGKTDKLTDAPACVCPALRAFVVSWNDSIKSDEDRTSILGPILSKLLDTKSTPSVETRRSWMATDWGVRVFAPEWLDLAGLGEHAKALRYLPEITSRAAAEAAMPAVRAANSAAYAARNAARNAAEDAAEDAAWGAAGDAAWGAAWAAAKAAAKDAAWDAARVALQPTVQRLQTSALRLIDRMIEVKS